MRLIIKTLYWLMLATLMGAAALMASYVRRSHQMDTMIADVAAAQQIDARLAVALVQRSSGYDTAMVTNARHGLLALRIEDGVAWAKATGAPFDVFDLFDPRRNLEIGLWKLSLAQLAWKGERDAAIWALVEWRVGRAVAKGWAEKSQPGSPLNAIDDIALRSFVSDVLAASRRGKLTLKLPLLRP